MKISYSGYIPGPVSLPMQCNNVNDMDFIDKAKLVALCQKSVTCDHRLFAPSLQFGYIEKLAFQPFHVRVNLKLKNWSERNWFQSVIFHKSNI